MPSLSIYDLRNFKFATALRAIVAARAFGGQLLDCENVNETLVGAGGVWSENTLGQGAVLARCHCLLVGQSNLSQILKEQAS
jgi:hypothetical protein